MMSRNFEANLDNLNPNSKVNFSSTEDDVPIVDSGQLSDVSTFEQL